MTYALQIEIIFEINTMVQRTRQEINKIFCSEIRSDLFQLYEVNGQNCLVDFET